MRRRYILGALYVRNKRAKFRSFLPFPEGVMRKALLALTCQEAVQRTQRTLRTFTTTTNNLHLLPDASSISPSARKWAFAHHERRAGSERGRLSGNSRSHSRFLLCSRSHFYTCLFRYQRNYDARP